MKKIYLSLFALALLGAGCANTPAPSTETSMPADESQLGPVTFEFTEDPSYTLTFPNSWFGVTSLEDFGGYVGESGPPDFDIPGKVRTFSFGEGRVPLFTVIKVDLKYKGHKSIPKTDTFLGENSTSAFYGGVVTKDSQEWSYLYDGQQDIYAESMKEIPAIFSSFRVK